MNDVFFNLGTAIAASRHGISRDEWLQKSARAAVMQSPEAIPFRRELCKIAYAAFCADGSGHLPEAILFNNLSKAAEWYASYDRFSDVVLRALAKGETEKRAAMLLPAVAALHDKAGGGVMKTLAAGGALGGVALGSLAFLLSRNAQQSSAQNAILLEKVKAYKKLKRDILEDMEQQDLMQRKTTRRSPDRYDV